MLKTFLLFSYGYFIAFLLGCVQVPVITRLVIPEDFGIGALFLLVSSLLLMAILMGWDQAFVRYFHEKAQCEKFELLVSCFCMPAVLLCAVTLLLCVFYDPLSVFICGKKSFLLVLLLIIHLILSLVMRFSSAVVRMKGMPKYFSNAQIAYKGSYFVFILLLAFLIRHDKYFLLIAAELLALTIQVAVLTAPFLKKIFRYKFSISSAMHQWGTYFRFSAPLLFGTFAVWIFANLDKVTLKTWSTVSELGIYSATGKICVALTLLQASFSSFWTPLCYAHHNENPENKILKEPTLEKLVPTIRILTLFVSTN